MGKLTRKYFSVEYQGRGLEFRETEESVYGSYSGYNCSGLVRQVRRYIYRCSHVRLLHGGIEPTTINVQAKPVLDATVVSS